MTSAEANYRVAAGLLPSHRPLTLAQVVEASGVSRAAAMAALDGLVEAGDVAAAELGKGEPGPQYPWAALPDDDSSRRAPACRFSAGKDGSGWRC